MRFILETWTFMLGIVLTNTIFAQGIVEYADSLQATQNYEIAWCRQDSDIRFRLSARATGWLAVGFNNAPQMVPADVIMATGEGAIQDGLADIYGPPMADASQDATLLSHSQVDGITTIELSRPIDTQDSVTDYTLDGERYLVWAMHFSNDSLMSRHTQRGIASSPINLAASAACVISNPFQADINGDGMLDVADVNLLLAGVRAGTHQDSLDVNQDMMVDTQDIADYLAETFNSYIGDANLDGEFSTTDLVAVFTVGQYEDATPLNSQWQSGDWNGDGDFSTGDLVFAFQEGGFEAGPRTAVAVPEPASSILWGIAALTVLTPRRRRR